MRKLDVVVNGVATGCADGGRVLDAVRSAGFKVPTLCYDERVGPKGTCRACLVEIELPGPAGSRKQTVAACTWLASDGMKVATHTEEVKEYRRTLLELLLSETASPAGCPRCNYLARCEFHAACEEYGARPDRFKPLPRREKAVDPNPFIQRDYDYCIACYRCTNICNEWEQAAAITVDGRGQQSRIFSKFNNLLLESPCTFCGQCINTCPTGALTDRKTLNSVRALTPPESITPLPVRLTPLPAGEGLGEGEPPANAYARPATGLTRTKTICPYCGVGCGINLLSHNGKVAGVEPDFTAPSRGSLCVKGQFASWEFVRSEDRLRHPLIRRNGALERATWDEALGLVAGRFKDIAAKHGADAIVCWASARVVTEANYLMQKFARVALGTNNIDNCSRT